MEPASSPVVTPCGHLYCWPCLYTWLQRSAACPVCKGRIDESKVIPLYDVGGEDRHAKVPASGTAPQVSQPLPGSGSSSGGASASNSAGTSTATGSHIPPRPASHRAEAPASAPSMPGGPGLRGSQPGVGGIHLHAGVGFFPSLFGLTFVRACATQLAMLCHSRATAKRAASHCARSTRPHFGLTR